MLKIAKDQRQHKPNIEALEKILDSIIVAVGKQKERYQKYVTAALEQGIEPREIFNLARETKRLRKYKDNLQLEP